MSTPKKIISTLIALLFIGFIYYFTIGSTQLTQEIKSQVNNELLALEQHGFKIEERHTQKSEEHFIISFENAAQITSFLQKTGTKIKQEDTEALIGLKIGVDLKYLNNAYSALSVDMYPLTLPQSITQANTNSKDKVFIAHLSDMLKRKAILLHIDFNKLLSSFKGSLKNIHEVVQSEKITTFDLKGNTFQGDINKNTISQLTQKVEIASIKVANELTFNANGLSSSYQITGMTPYDSHSEYRIKRIDISGKAKQSTYTFTMDTLYSKAESKINNGLIQSNIDSSIKEINSEFNHQKNQLKELTFNFNIDNLNMAALQALNKLDMNNTLEKRKLLQDIFSKGVTMNISPFKVKQLILNSKKMEGFTVESHLDISKSTQIEKIEANPLELLNIINSKTKVTLSPELFSFIAKDPRAMLLLMVLKPQEVNQQKVFEVELKNGKLTVNGMPML